MARKRKKITSIGFREAMDRYVDRNYVDIDMTKEEWIHLIVTAPKEERRELMKDRKLNGVPIILTD